MFAGFLPSAYETTRLADRELLFFPKHIGLGRKVPEGAFGFSGSTIVEGLASVGYDTWCVGGVAFFDKRSDMGKVFPGYFQKSYWNPSFAPPVKDSTKNQVDLILKKIAAAEKSPPIFLYLNVDAIHYPNHFYLEGAKKDSLKSHKAASRPRWSDPQTRPRSHPTPAHIAQAAAPPRPDIAPPPPPPAL